MSYPYISDLMFGSEMSAVGGNVPSVVSSTSSPEYGPVEPVEGVVFCSSIREIFKEIENEGVKVMEAWECYYVFDLESVSAEGEYLENLKTVLRKLKVDIWQELKSSSVKVYIPFDADSSQYDGHKSSHNLDSIIQGMGDGWSLYLGTDGNLTLEFPDAPDSTSSIEASFYSTVDDSPKHPTDFFYLDEIITEATQPAYSDRVFTFTDK